MVSCQICNLILQSRRFPLRNSSASSSECHNIIAPSVCLSGQQRRQQDPGQLSSNMQQPPWQGGFDRAGFDEVSQSLSIMMRLIPPVNKTATRRICNRTGSIVAINCARVMGDGKCVFVCVWGWERLASTGGQRWIHYR